MNIIELFAGVGGFGLAAEAAGYTVDLACEYDDKAAAVLAARFPDTTLYGDVATLRGDGSRPTVLTAGSPCQDFSIAGMRKGLAGSRSGLFEHVIRLRDEYQPRFVVWENVPGALTSNKGEDFANVIGALVGAPGPLTLPKHPSGRRSRYAGVAQGPKGTLAWRVLDAQHFGVPQRRQRVFAVLDTQSDASVSALFPGYAPNDWWTWGTAPAFCGDSWAMPIDVDSIDLDTGMSPPDPKTTRLADILERDVDERYYLSVKACKGIIRRAEKRGRQLPPLLDHALRFQAGEDVGEAPRREPVPVLSPAENQRGELRTADIAPVMSIGGGKPGQGYQAVLEPVPFNGACVHDGPARTGAFTKGTGIGAPGDPSPTVHGSTVHCVAAPTLSVNARQDPVTAADLLAGPLDTDGGTHAVSCPPLYRVRRLTPTECERLQGFPDGWTAIDGAKDSHRYRQLGNAVAAPVAEWVLRRIAEVSS